MAYTATVTIANRTEAELTIFVEPGTQLVKLPAGRQVRVVAEGDRPGEFDIDHSGTFMTVSAWANAVARFEVQGSQVESQSELPGPVLSGAGPGEKPPSYVSSILVGDNEVTLEASTDVDARDLQALGGRRQLLRRRTWVFPGRDESSLGALLHGLRDLGVAFGWEPSGWPPAAVFAHLRDRGVVHGTIKAIAWRARDDFQVFEF